MHFDLRLDRGGIPGALAGRMKPFDLIKRTRLFALDVRIFCGQLPATDEGREAGQQLRRAGNSTRSNYRAARKARSPDEFTSKLQIAFEEADEAFDWLVYLRDSNIHENPSLLQEAFEISSILGAAVKTARRNQQARRQGRRRKPPPNF